MKPHDCVKDLLTMVTRGSDYYLTIVSGNKAVKIKNVRLSSQLVSIWHFCFHF